MPLAINSIQVASKPKAGTLKSAERISSQHAIAEINAYITIRDNLLAEAEESATGATLKRVSLANDLVATSLRPARSPYEAQYLPEPDAIRERKHCELVKNRISELRARVV